MNGQTFLTVAQAVQACADIGEKISAPTIRAWLNDGTLKKYTAGKNSVRVDKDELIAFVTPKRQQ